MQSASLPFVKICCTSSPEEAAQTITADASAIGLVPAMTSNPGISDEKLIAEIFCFVSSPFANSLRTFLEDTEATMVPEYANARSLDSDKPIFPIKQPSGIRCHHEWRISHPIRYSVKTFLFLAEGLHPENVASTIETVTPFSINVDNAVLHKRQTRCKKTEYLFY